MRCSEGMEIQYKFKHMCLVTMLAKKKQAGVLTRNTYVIEIQNKSTIGSTGDFGIFIPSALFIYQ